LFKLLADQRTRGWLKHTNVRKKMVVLGMPPTRTLHTSWSFVAVALKWISFKLKQT